MKILVQKMKELMKQRENVSRVKQYLKNLNTKRAWATASQNKLLPVLPERELKIHKEWFSSIINYSNTFQKETQRLN